MLNIKENKNFLIMKYLGALIDIKINNNHRIFILKISKI
jgi:hypothetical protein